MAKMSRKEIKRFLIQGTLTWKLATIKKDKSPHIVPVWFVLNKSHNGEEVGDSIEDGQYHKIGSI
jgi:nitroimidazol reductase NimA-like FMN-containing flavoprotein (pyridoxamine 5'-phosphate oxidase superfamily)